jgi:glycosyltransferase involved in cell wall biosynthesis
MPSSQETSSLPINPKHIAFFLPSLAGGGVARVMLHLAQSFSELGMRVDLVLCEKEGPYLSQVPKNIKIVELKADPSWKARLRLAFDHFNLLPYLLLPILLPVKPPKAFRYIGDLERFFKNEKPDVILAAKTHANLAVLLVHKKLRSLVRVIISERLAMTEYIKASKRWRWRYILPLVRKVYPQADKIITVSQGIAEELVIHGKINRSSITTIYNPINIVKIKEKCQATVNYSWFSDGVPVILGIGRLSFQKDFPTLLRAFGYVRRIRHVRLILLGEGRERETLEALAKKLNIQEDVWMPGFLENPYALMSKASVFALSSVIEGFPNVLLEALACGCPVVSTDCPTGPRELLDYGAIGPLVPMRDAEALGKAILSTLDHPPPAQLLEARAAEFDLKKISSQYLSVLLGE